MVGSDPPLEVLPVECTKHYFGFGSVTAFTANMIVSNK